MIVAAGVNVLELPGFVVVPLGVHALEQEPLDFVGGVQRVALLVEKAFGVVLQDTANVGAIGAAVFVDHFAEHHHLARAEEVGGRPVERAPVDTQPQVAFTLRGKTTNRRAVECKVVIALDQELLVVVEHVQAAFEVAEQQCHGLDALLVREVLEAFFANLLGRNAFGALLLGVHVQLFQFAIGKLKKVLQLNAHGSPWFGFCERRASEANRYRGTRA